MRGKLLRPLKSHNSPFNSSVLGCQAFNKSEAKGDLVYDTNLAASQV